MLDRLIIKAANLCPCYKIPKAMKHAMEVLYRNDKCFHNTLKVVENMTALTDKATFNGL